MKLRPSPLAGDEIDVLLRNDFASFVQAAFSQVTPGTKLIWAPYLDLICAMLEAIAHGRKRNLIITMPPRHLKSFCVSVALPAFVLGHYPSQQVMCVSYGQDLAKTFAENTQTLMQSDMYVRLFGEVLGPRRQPVLYFRTVGGGGRRATSMDGTATGAGADLMIFDDPQKPGETLSEAVRRSTNQTYENTFLSRRNDPATARTVIVMQRLHEDDFVAHVQGLGGDWDVLNLPAIAEEAEAIPFETFLGETVFRRKEGDPLHPKRIPLDELALVRSSLGEAVWSTQYQQRPAPAGGGLVKTDWFRRYNPANLPAGFDRIVQSWDTANKIAQWNDFSVCTTWGVKGRHAYLLHVFRSRLIYPDLKAAVLSQAHLHNATVVFVEDHASGTQLLQELRDQGFGKLRGVKHTSDKQTRMVNQTARIENGFVHIPADAPWLPDYLHELAFFPNSRFDDQVDSTSQGLENIFSSSNGQGYFEWMRQEAEKLRAPDDEMVKLRGPIPIGMFSDIEGVQHRPQADGTFHVTRRQAAPLLNQVGWSISTL
jgi:predicted phage terminase large subunit-like protein